MEDTTVYCVHWSSFAPEEDGPTNDIIGVYLTEAEAWAEAEGYAENYSTHTHWMKKDREAGFIEARTPDNGYMYATIYRATLYAGAPAGLETDTDG